MRTIALIAAATCTAAGAGSALAAAPGSTPACRYDQLVVRIGDRGGAMGTTYSSIVFTNRSHSACHLRGYPGVSSVAGADGHQVGAAARRDPSPVATIVLAADGGRAIARYAETTLANIPAARCRPRRVRGLRVYAPNQARAFFIRYRHVACSARRLQATFVRAVVSG